jgi:hypothetical protein
VRRIISREPTIILVLPDGVAIPRLADASGVEPYHIDTGRECVEGGIRPQRVARKRHRPRSDSRYGTVSSAREQPGLGVFDGIQ